MCSYNEFVEAYNDPKLTTHDVRRVKGLNSNKYCRLRAKALKNGDIPEHRNIIQDNAKYYIKTTNGFQVQKTINGHKIIVGRFKNEKTAQEIVKACIDAEWDLNKITNLIRLKEIKPKNYSCVYNSWVIQKSINGKNTIFNRFSKNKVDEQTVIDIVDFYRANDWDYSLRSEVYDLFNIT